MTPNNSILLLQHNNSNNYNSDVYKSGKHLKSLWLSLPAFCHLSCPYCFASTNSPGKKIDILSENQYEKIIREFAMLGGEFIGIPGDGEPFHPKSWELTKFVLNLCDELKIKVALFTTGDLIFFNIDGSRSDNEKIDFIKTKNVVLLIKYNHSNEAIQNRLVGGKNKNYTKNREQSLDLLINTYKLNQQKRVGLVTSILRENSEREEPNGKLEIINIYERTQRDNLIFDCDTILELGRGKTFTSIDNGVLSQIEMEDVFKKLTDAGAVGLNQGGTYVGNTCCDRILHHLYIKSNGDVFPCIGCSREDLVNKMILGSINTNSLKNLWEQPLRRKLAEKRYVTLIGVCANCENFKTEKCYSCLGRCIISDTYGNPINEEGTINTIGCLHHKPSTTIWLANLVDYIRTTLSYKVTTDSLKDINTGLEQLWRPNKNIAYTLFQLTLDERIKEIKNLIDFVGNPHDDNNYKPFHKIRNSKIANFSQKKHFRFADLQFPMNKVWDFVKDPEEHFKPKDKFGPDFENKKQQIIKTISQSFLSNVFLSSFKILFDKYDSNDQNIVYCNFILYDNIREKYFYRSISKGTDSNNEQFEIVISRWYEDLFIDGRNENPWKERCHNLSASLRHELYGDYELKLNSSINEEDNDIDLLQRTIDLSDILIIPSIKSKVIAFKEFLKSAEFEANYSVVRDFINTKIFTELNIERSNKIKKFYSIVNNIAYFDSKDNSKIEKLIGQIHQIFENIEQKLLKQERDIAIIKKLKEELNRVKADGTEWKFVNYFVYLGIMHTILDVNYYYLLHSTNFATINPVQKGLLANSELSGIIKSSGLLVCTKNPIKQEFRAELKLFLSNIMAPFDEFYFNLRIQDVKLYDEVQWYQHSLDNIYRDVIDGLQQFNYLINQKNIRDNILVNVTKVLDANFKVYDISRRGISGKYESINSYQELKDLYSMIDLVITSIHREDFNFISNSNSFLLGDNFPREKLLLFTIIWNLLHNAHKFRNDQKVEIVFDNVNKILNISNNEPMPEKYINYINMEINTYPSERKHGGLAIVKSLNEILSTSIKVSLNKSITTISINCENLKGYEK